MMRVRACRRLVGWFVVVLLLGGVTPAWADEAEEAADPVRVGWLELSGALREGPAPFRWVDEGELDPSLPEVLDQLAHVADSDEHGGVVVYLDRPELALSQVEALREGFEQVREADKRVIAFAQSYDTLGYLLASAADEVLLQHGGRVELSGLSLEELYLGELLGKLGVEADLMQVGEAKGAMEPWSRRGPSEAWDRNMEALLDDLYAQVLGRLSEGRGLEAEAIERAMAEGWMMRDGEYVEAGLVDALVERDLLEAAKARFGEHYAWDERMGRQPARGAGGENPFAMFQMLFQAPDTEPTEPSIAVIRVSGPIVPGESTYGEGLLGVEQAGSRTVVKHLGQVRDDPRIKGAVVRIDSPGGSPLASEMIWQAIRSAAETKPVYASVDELAASGGYYVASAAERIYAAPQSLVGSIGVVGGKIVLGDLYEKVGVSVHRRSRGPGADLFNSVEPFTEEQRQVVRAGLERVYEQFTDRVARGRGERVSDMEAVAGGRVFTGEQAAGNGLADVAGGFAAARRAVAEAAGLEEGEYELLHLPGPMDLGAFLESLFGVRGGDAGVSWDSLGAARLVLGESRWEAARRALAGLLLLRDEPAVLVMPAVLGVE